MTKRITGPAEVEQDARIFAAMTLVLAGVATWEIVVTFPFDWNIITWRRKWQWPMGLYVLCRISLVVLVWTLAVNVNAYTKIDCNAASWASKITTVTGAWVSSSILGLRTYAIWGRDRNVGVLLLVLSIGQIATSIQLTRFWESTWNSTLNTCIFSTSPDRFVYILPYVFTLGFDSLILGLMLWKVGKHAKSDVINALLFRDAVRYCAISVTANGVAVIFAALHRTQMMNVMGNPFAGIMSMIAASRIFRHTFEESGSLLSREASSGPVSTIAFRNGLISRSDRHTLELPDVCGILEVRDVRLLGHTEIEVERDAESEDEKDVSNGVHQFSGQSKTDELPPKAPSLLP